ncbi:lipopolysaccharide-responsive and beige-like anchor protein [Montipora capricornis]|uniref:lipopolysaccharide-responsive and beige-like anchor protein n=1 Tax=Montipora capricornis TaxID=246305 RepID=UPI0035F1397A
MADSPAIDTSQNDQVLPEKENHENGVRKTIDKERSINAVSVASRTKLAQLIQLASEAETEGLTNYKKVVDTVFDSLVGGHFDLEARFTIKDSSDLLMLLELLGHCNVSLKVEILGLLIAILRKSIPNLQAATKIGLTERVLCRLPQEREVVADKLVELLGILSSYSITVKELKTLLATLKGVNGKWPCHTVKLLTILKLMLEKQGPDVYFSFSGQHGAAITLPPISKWPLQSGFTFSTWLCLDTSHLANAEKRRPYLYCFRTGKGVGYSAHFSGPMLVLECAVKTGKRENKIFRHLVKFEFHPQKWYMVTVVHEHNRFHASEIRCFVNGRVVSSGKTTLVHATEPFDKCYIGSSPMADSSTVFCGQIAAVYLFSEALTAQTVGAMHRLGPGYKGQFKFPAEIDIPLSDQDRKVLYEGHLSSVIMFMYTPKACDQQLCLEASPTENHSFFCHSPHALMLEGVQSVVTHSLQSILHSLGGIQMLLPLFTQLDFPQEGAEDTSEVPEVAICTVLLSLLSDLLRRSCTSQQQMIQCQGFLVISHILEKAVSTHLTEDALGILVSLARHLLNSLSSGLLLGSLLDHILFNPNLWVKASPKVQLQLFSVFATDLATGRGCAAHMRHDVGVSRLMHMLKTFYCLDSGSKLDQDGQVQSRDGVHSLRAFLLLLVKQLVLKDKGITEEEFKSILTYLMIFDQEENLLDVLQLVLSIMTEQPDTSIPVFDRVDGLRVLFRFLDMKSEAVRVYSLKIIGCFLQFCPARRKQDLLEHFSLFSLIGDKLMNHTLTLTTYNVLFEILVGRVSKQVVSGHHPQPDNTFLLQNTTMAPVIARMLQKNAGKHCNVGVTLTRQGSFKEERTPEEDKVDLKRKFLSDLVLLLNHNQVNRSLILQLSCWQDWLFALAHVEPANAEENRITDTVFSLFRMLLHHAFQEEREGWRIWVDTLAILHGKVSSHEGVKARDPSKREEVTPCTTGSSGEESKTRGELFKSASEQPTLETKSTDSDADRRKFFQSLIQSKNGPKANEPLSTDTPEEKESNPSSPVNGKEEAIDSRNTEETSELKNAMSRTRNEQENLEPVNSTSQQELSLSVTGVDTELRGTEVAAELNVQGVDLADTGLTVEDVVDKETKDSNVVESCLEENTDTKSVENAEALSTIEGDASSLIEKDEIAREVDDESTISPPAETEGSADGMLSSDESKSPFASHSRRVKHFARSVEITEVNANSRLDQDLLNETEKPRDVDSSLTIAVKSSYIGAAIENSEDAKTKSENKESGDPVQKVTPEGVGENDEQNGHAPKESTVSQFHTEASSTDHPHQPDSTKGSSETGAESGPDSSSSASAAARSEESSDQKSTYRAYVNIPEYLWSPIHQRLLGDLLFAFESDIQVWRSHNRKSVMDFVNAKDNATYLWNLAHFVSVLADNVIFCCGDLLPLLSSVTSRDYGQDVIEPCGGMSLETSFSFLNRLMSLVDVIVFTSSLAFSGVEGNRNLSTGGFLRQCLRLVFCCAARNRLVCRQRNRPILPQITSGKLGKKALKEARQAIKTLIASTKPPSEQDVVQNIPGHMTTVTDPEKLLQEMDVNRLRAVVYRDFEDSKQAQFLALTVVYFIAVMMVAKYRDLLRSDDPEARARYHSMTSSDSTATEGEAQNQTGSRSRAASWGGQRNASAEVEEDMFNWNEGMALPSLMKSAVDFNRLSLSEKLEIGFKSSGSLLKEILVDFSPFLSRFLVGSHGQELVLEGLSCQKTDSVVELVMLLCSQEWQNSLQRNGGMAFMELVNEGRLLSHAMRERIVMTTSEAFVIVNKLEGISRQKHMQFVDLCRLTEATYSENDKLQDQLLLATKRRDFSVAKNVIQKVLDIITSEHGAWSVGQQPPSTIQFYRLDMWEDDSRRRMRFVKNEYGSSHPEATLLEGIEGINKDVSANPQHLNFAKISSAKPEDSYSLDEEEIAEMVIEERNLGRDVSGHVIFTSSCHLIAPCVVAPGSLTVTSEAVFFTVDEENPEYQKLDPKILMYMDGLHGKWPLDAIKAVFSRRYLLQNCALELYTSAGTSVMLKFADQQTVRKVVRALPPVGIGAYYGIPQTRAASLYSPRQLFQKSTMTQRWQKGEVSNFQYLMFLNTIAGRSFCDLNQYPVFPWVLTNFEADSLDLTDPKIYRDLSKPIGALNPTRHAQFVERYASWDENDDIPPFHYGTHYSTCGFTLAWMIRVEPFATQFLNLQGGKFDHPGRTFCSIIRSWQNCQRDTSDVKELIPELFYLPEMFLNSNNFTFGIDDDGVVIDDVELPKWASTPEEFVMLHRAALESKYVSAHLHEWIDLIFGFKQKGPEAVKATNVFFHLTYEGSVDLDSIADPVMREAVEQQIKSFGQTPSQLLHDPHVPRLLPEIQNNEEEEPFKSVFLTFKVTPDVPVTHVAANTDSTVPSPAVVTISCNQCFSVNKWFLSGNTNLREVQVEQDPMLATTAGRNKRQLGEPLDQSVTPSACCFAVTADNKYIMACGYWDNSFKCFSADSGRLTQCVFGHWDVVTCLAYSRHEGLTGGDAFVVSGSRDATVLVWRWNERLQRVAESERAEGDNPSPLAILTGHEQPVVCLDVNASLGLVVSGSQEGACLLHTTAGNLLRTLRGPGDCVRPRLLKLSRDGLILVNYTDGNGHLAVFTVNGRLLSDKKLDDQMLAVALNKDGNFFVSGGFSRYLRIWRTHDLRLLHTYPPCDGSIRALAVSTDQRCLVAGLASGKILAIAVDFPGRL